MSADDVIVGAVALLCGFAMPVLEVLGLALVRKVTVRMGVHESQRGVLISLDMLALAFAFGATIAVFAAALVLTSGSPRIAVLAYGIGIAAVRPAIARYRTI